MDLNSFKCYIPWECTHRKLEINHTVWDVLSAADRKADPDDNLYKCVFETTDEDGSGPRKHEMFAKDYMLIGDPDFIKTNQAGFAFDVDTNTCTLAATNLAYFDKQTGLCYGINNADGSIETLHLYQQQYTVAELTFTSADNTVAWIDYPNGKCWYNGEAALCTATY